MPLALDLSAADRAALDDAAEDAVAVVAYDGASLRVLRGCTLAGSYGFMLALAETREVRLENADEVAASLPSTGASLARRFAGELARGAQVVVSATRSGIKRTTRARADRAALAGACDGATHFVRGVVLGAFRAELRAVGAAPVPLLAYGDAGACKQPPAEAFDPPDRCDGPLWMELRALGGGPAPVDELDRRCPRDFVWTDGKCARFSTLRPHFCAPDDAAACARECDRGDALSCRMRGDLEIADASGDRASALALYVRGCEGGAASACGRAGRMLLTGNGVAVDAARAVPLLVRGCELGGARA